MSVTYRLKGKVWLYDGAGGWHFVTLPKGPAQELRGAFDTGRGWGAIPVRVTLGATTWTTSIFPEKESGSYVLPLKADVRKAEGIKAGATVEFVLQAGPTAGS